MFDSLTVIIIAVTVLVSLLAFSEQRAFTALLFEPFVVSARNEWYRLVTHAFVHANLPHLFVNMFVLYMFGTNVEMLYAFLTDGTGTVSYLLLYFGGVVLSALPAYRRHRFDPNYRAVGASGAVSAVLFAHILMLPTSPVYFFFIPVPIPSWLFGILYLGYSWYMDKRGGDNIAHDAHFHGAVYGILFSIALEPDLLFRFGHLMQLQ